MFTRKQKLEYMKSLMWDYNIPPEHCLEVLEGKRKKAAHYTEETLFRKMLETFPWFTIIRLLPIQRIYKLMTDKTIYSLRFKSLISKYEFVRNKLRKTL